MGKCKNCGKESPEISDVIGFCADCIRKGEADLSLLHKKSREIFGLPPFPPKSENGIKCGMCVNECILNEGETGYCGIRKNINGKIVTIANGHLDYYFDPLPTNCVAEWVCPGRFAYGYKNLAVFYRACTFNCLFCQNWHFKQGSIREVPPDVLAEEVDDRTFCICYFGGDPTPQLPHAIKTSRLALQKRKIRICFETNGTMNRNLLEEAAEIVFESGGCIKFDLKAYTKNLNVALCGITNERTFENFEYLVKYFKKRKEPPFLVASTLLVPGYIDLYEVEQIAKFLYKLDPDIPYSLLAFYPSFILNDLPTTSREHAFAARDIALKIGLKRVNIGNIHLLR